MQRSVLKVKELTSENILALANSEINAISVEGFYDHDLCDKMYDFFVKNIEYCINAPSIGRIGMAFYETDSKDELIEDYYINSRKRINSIRSAFHPYLSPIDKYKLRLYLQEIWVQGANIENIHDRKMFIGLCRVVEPNIDFLPHQDKLSKDAMYIEKSLGLIGQFAANIYLDIPEEGGEIDMWSEELDDDTYDSLRKGGSYGIERNLLPKPCSTYKPQKGELFIFNAKKLHAVKAVKGSPRLSISSFIGYYGFDKPLIYWS